MGFNMGLVCLACLVLPVVYVSCQKEGINALEIHQDKKSVAPKFWKAEVGEYCQYNNESFPLPSGYPDKFLECMIPTDNKEIWPWNDKGVWILRRCMPGTYFYPATRTCKTQRFIRLKEKNIRRQCGSGGCGGQFIVQPQASYSGSCSCPVQQPNCGCPQTQVIQPQPYIPPQQPYIPPQQPYIPPQQPYIPPQQPYISPQQPYIQPQQPYIQPPIQQQCSCPAPCPPQQPICPPVQQPCPCPQQVIAQPQPCPNAPFSGTQGAQAGAPCSWMLAPLAQNNQPTTYLQCSPAGPPNTNPYCGTWCVRLCAPGTTFDVTVQVCVGTLTGPGGAACGCTGGVQITNQCGAGNNCPGSSQCQISVPAAVPFQPQQVMQPQCSACCSGGGGYGKK